MRLRYYKKKNKKNITLHKIKVSAHSNITNKYKTDN